MPRVVLFVIALVASFGSFDATTASADKARVSLVEARTIALARVPGTIVHEKLKSKKHGNPIYSIKIHAREMKTSTTLKKVEVDGETGKIVKVKDVPAKQAPARTEKPGTAPKSTRKPTPDDDGD
jgi:hypothetical protein